MSGAGAYTRSQPIKADHSRPRIKYVSLNCRDRCPTGLEMQARFSLHFCQSFSGTFSRYQGTVKASQPMVKSSSVWMRYFSIPKILLPVRLTALTFLVGCSHPGFRHPVPLRHLACTKSLRGCSGKRYVDKPTLWHSKKAGPRSGLSTLESSGTIEAAA